MLYLSLCVAYTVETSELTVFCSYWEYLECAERFGCLQKKVILYSKLLKLESLEFSVSLHDTASQSLLLSANCRETCTILSRSSGSRSFVNESQMILLFKHTILAAMRYVTVLCSLALYI